MHVCVCVCVCVCSGAKLTGPFVTMIYKMLSGDLFRFAIIYCIFLVGFTQGRLWFQRTLHHCQLLYLQSSVFKSVVVLAQERERLGGGGVGVGGGASKKNSKFFNVSVYPTSLH